MYLIVNALDPIVYDFECYHNVDLGRFDCDRTQFHPIQQGSYDDENTMKISKVQESFEYCGANQMSSIYILVSLRRFFWGGGGGSFYKDCGSNCPPAFYAFGKYKFLPQFLRIS
eukprot:TRINITY_DN38642_c0_g1_i1.p2 TRINITY_DN38642_c0_g1~~TRINITY_DN38642_c0_g1_i1.p2  ORF type:complete len:114 (-),score=5.32 TRINITY_DN38642_c0_g1_i1:37-378(-)